VEIRETVIKIGDLVQIKLISCAQVRRNMMSNDPVNKLGIVVEVTENTCEVMFPTNGGKVHLFLMSNLEVITI